MHSGLVEKNAEDKPDIYIINSCTVTHRADSDTRRIVRQFHKINPEAKIVIAGCYAEKKEDRDGLLKIKGVSHLLTLKEKRDITGFISKELKIISAAPLDGINNFHDKDRAFIKIQDGCDNRCAYCKVSLVRGNSESRPPDKIVSEVRRIISHGFKEIVLTGICMGSWGNDFKVKKGIEDLLEEIMKIEGDFRIRLSSIEPKYVTQRLVAIIESSCKICKHLHIPLQSGDDKILKAMNRGYDTKWFSQMLSMARNIIPDVAFTTDIIVGFPGEDDKSFENTYEFVQRIMPSRIHIFTYSPRKGTTSYNLKNAPHSLKVKERVKDLESLSVKLMDSYRKIFTGQLVQVLVESHRDKTTGKLSGYTDKYVRMTFDGPDSLKGKLVSIKA